MGGPLEGIRVADLTRILAGPYCTMMLADMGAEVIKIERPGSGDDTRAWGPPFLNGVSTYFLSINRNKKSLTLDLKHPRGKELLRALIERSDVVAENFRPGTMEGLGFGYEEVRRINPRAIYVAVSGFGHSGPRRSEPGFDLILQGEGGVMSVTGDPEGPPTKVGVSQADIVAGMLAAYGTLLALWARERTGRGQKVDASLLDGQVALLTYQAGIYFAIGKAPSRMGNLHPSITPYETFRCRDGHLNLGVGNENLWATFLKAIGREDLREDPRFVTNARRVENREALRPILDEFFADQELAAILKKLQARGIPCGPIKDVAQVCTDPQVLAREMVVDIIHPEAGPTRVTGVPIQLSETPGAVRTPPPTLGQHTDEVLAEVLGVGGEERGRLREEGVV
ncbi:MAG: CaiB/BaiF CoA transferase family protein [Nitrospinota bacterium]